MQLVVISKERFFAGESKIVNQLFKEGLKYFHLRKPNASEKEIISFLDQIDHSFRCRISLHDQHQLAKGFGINRLHFKESSRLHPNEKMIEDLANKEYSYSTSVHSVQNLKSISKNYDYTFLSPVFDSISKINYPGFTNPDFHLKNEWKQTAIIGLGGINEANFSRLKEMNFDGGAVLGYLWERPEEALQNFIKLRRYAE